MDKLLTLDGHISDITTYGNEIMPMPPQKIVIDSPMIERFFVIIKCSLRP